MAKKMVSIGQLRVGLFIRLHLNWYEHPFLFNSFKISNPRQIRTLQELGITHVQYDPDKSEVAPLDSSVEISTGEEQERTDVSESTQKLWENKQQRIELHATRSRNFHKCEKDFEHTFVRARGVIQRLAAGSRGVTEDARRLVNDVVDSLLSEKELIVNLMNVRGGDDNAFYHALNVAMLSLMLGKESGLSSEELQDLGLGALFHDIGKSSIPKKYWLMRENMLPAEIELVHRHTRYGEEMVRQIKGFPKNALQIIAQHHETVDGRGYPLGLRGSSISRLASMTALCDAYDNLCNPLDPELAITPHEALSHLYYHEGYKYPGKLIPLFIRCVGVFPPGTVVELSSGQPAMVMSHNSRDPLRPSILIFDAEIPKREAALVDLEQESHLRIVKSIRASRLSPEAFYYLSPRSRLNYFFEREGDSPPPPPTTPSSPSPHAKR